MDRTEIAIEAWRTVDEIKAGPVYREFVESQDALLGPGGPAAAITRFERAKAAFAPVAAIGKSHPDFKRLAAALAIAKTELYETPAYRRHADARTALDAVLDGIGGGIRAILDSCRAGTQTQCGKR